MSQLFSSAIKKTLSLKVGRYSLRWQITSFLILGLLITLLVIGVGVVTFVYNTEVAAWRGRQGEAARNAGNTVGAFIHRAADALSLVGLLGRDELTSKPELLSQVLAQNLALQEVVYLDAKGQVVASGSQDQLLLANLFTIPQSQWFLTAKQGQAYYGSLQTAAGNEPYLIIALPAPNGAVVAARLRMTVLWNVVSDIRFGQSGRAYIVDHGGQIIAHTDPQVVLAQTSLANQTSLMQALQNVSLEWSGEYQDLQGHPVVGVTASVPGTDWMVVTELLQSEAFATSRSALLILGSGLLVFGLLLTMVSGRYLEQMMFKPMEALRYGSERIGEGDLSYRIQLDRQDEVGQVAHAFNHMAARLYEQRLAVEHRNTQLEAIYQIGLSLTSNLEEKTVLDLILDSTFKLLPRLKDVHIFWYRQQRLMFAASLWVDGRRDYLAAEPRTDGLTYRVAQQGEAIVVPDIQTHPLYANTPSAWSGSLAGIPLKIGPRVVGVMTVAYPQPYTITEADLRMLRLMGDQAAIAIENAYLYEQAQQELLERQRAEANLQQTYSNLQRSNHLLAQILEVGSALNRNLNLDSLFQEIVYAVHDALGFGVVILNLVDEDRQQVQVGAHTGLDEADSQLLTTAIYPWAEFANLLQERFRLEGCYFIPHDEFDWERKFRGPVYTAVKEVDYNGRVNSWHPDDVLLVPIEIRSGQIKGIISVDQPLEGRRPDLETLRALQIFAHQAAAAIENAHLYEQVQQELADRKQAQQALHRFNTELEGRVTARTAELAAANQTLQAEIGERRRAEDKLRLTIERQILLYRVLRTISGQLDLDAVARLAVETIAELTDWPHICFAVPNEPGTHWVIRAAGGVLAAEVGLTCPMSHGVIGRVFRTGQTQLVPDVRTDPDYQGENPVLLSELAVSVRRGQQVVAVLNLEGDKPAMFGAEERQLGESLAEAIGLALENVRLFAAVQVELAERKWAEEQLRDSLHEKEMLLKEIHHRVKNNLQVVSSLLNLQSGYINDAHVQEIFQDSQNRVRSMALIHEKLYRSKNLAEIDLGEYVRELAMFLFSSYKAAGRGITLKVQAANVYLGIDSAVPCGLIINELISNSLKHAFPAGRSGEIYLELSCQTDNQTMLTIRDTGVGFPPELDFRETNSLGLQLVNTLVDQLDGKIDLQRNHGSQFKITFPTK
jgi:two-component sensor histidine kinase/putative methionine-R-sulfoxide reductase with GAF domain